MDIRIKKKIINFLITLAIFAIGMSSIFVIRDMMPKKVVRRHVDIKDLPIWTVLLCTVYGTSNLNNLKENLYEHHADFRVVEFKNKKGTTGYQIFIGNNLNFWQAHDLLDELYEYLNIKGTILRDR